MIRICSSLESAGYNVLLVGRKGKKVSALEPKSYHQKRLFTFFKGGFGFYAEYNIRLFFYLLFTKADIFCCIDLDTMLPVLTASKFRGKKRVYDAHEFFTQQKEIITRPKVRLVWLWIEKTFLPKFKLGYAVSQSIANEFSHRYGVDYKVIRNLPLLKSSQSSSAAKQKTILYQGAVNEARGLEFLIPAMKDVEAELHVYGDGNFMEPTKSLIKSNNLQNKVFLKGKVLPTELDAITQRAYVGLNLVENNGLNQYYSLANKFFDYVQNGIPQVSMNFPEYKKINAEFEVAILIDDLQPSTIADTINSLLNNKELHDKLSNNCMQARETLNWQQEEKKLLAFYKSII